MNWAREVWLNKSILSQSIQSHQLGGARHVCGPKFTNLYGVSTYHGELEDGDELGQRRLVHDIDRVHFRDQEIQHRPAVSDGAELFAGGGDPQFRVARVPQLLLYSYTNCESQGC